MYKRTFAIFVFTMVIIFTTLPAMAAVFNVPSQFSTISLAMANAASGDTIIVAPGSYTEQVVMTEGVRLIGSGIGSSIIIAPTGISPVVTGASNSILEGFTVNNSAGHCIFLINVRHMIVSKIKAVSGGGVGFGITLDHSDYNTIQFVKAKSIDLGPNNPQNKIMYKGLSLQNSNYNHILSNQFNAFHGGIELYGSHNNKLEHNFSVSKSQSNGVSSGTGTGIVVSSSNNNALIHNTGISLQTFSLPSWNAGLAVDSSSNTTVTNSIFKGTGYGIVVRHSNGATTDLTIEYTDIKGAFQNYNLMGSPAIVYGNGVINVSPMINSATGALLTGSPCIDAGDPLMPHDPDTSIADLGAFYF